MNQNDVAVAFDTVLKEIENAIPALNREGAQAFQVGKYDSARELMEKGPQMKAVLTKLADLQKEWLNIFSAVTPSEGRYQNSNVITAYTYSQHQSNRFYRRMQ